jgi:hypothetical protein
MHTKRVVVEWQRGSPLIGMTVRGSRLQIRTLATPFDHSAGGTGNVGSGQRSAPYAPGICFVDTMCSPDRSAHVMHPRR